MAELDRARTAKRQLRAQLAGRGGISGVGITRVGDSFGLLVNVVHPADGAGLPAAVDGVAVRVKVTGPVSPLHARA